VKFAAASALMAGISLATLAASLSCADATPRGGTMVYGRYADSLFLDSVLNDANVDIWILSNLYDTDFRNT
jgi:peptide/nickel transport system substrate-binding protein